MRRILRFCLLLFCAASLAVLSNCSSPTANNPADSQSPATTTAASTQHMSHGGKAKININSAILSELDKIEAKLGLPALSNRIQASRPYGKPEELVEKKVITQAQYEQVKDLVTIEDIKLTGEAKDVDYMIKLGLMKGHLIVAKELLDLQKPDQAEPHIGHPVEEIYADVEEQLKERNVKEFKTQLVALQDLVKAGAKDAAKVSSDFKRIGAVSGWGDRRHLRHPAAVPFLRDAGAGGFAGHRQLRVRSRDRQRQDCSGDRISRLAGVCRLRQRTVQRHRACPREAECRYL